MVTSESLDFHPSFWTAHPRPWRLRPLDHKYYGTEILDAADAVVPGIQIWVGHRSGHPHEWLSPREVWEGPGDELSHREDINSYHLACLIVEVVNSYA